MKGGKLGTKGRVVAVLLVLLALGGIFAIAKSDHSYLLVRKSGERIGGSLFAFDEATKTVFIDGKPFDPGAVVGITQDSIIIRISRAVASMLDVTSGTQVNVFLVNGQEKAEANVGDVISWGTKITSLGDSTTIGSAFVRWVVTRPDGSTTGGYSTYFILPISSVTIYSPDSEKAIAGTYTVYATIEVSEFEMGGTLLSAQSAILTVGGGTVTPTPVPTSTPSPYTGDKSGPTIVCKGPATIDSNVNMQASCGIFDASGVGMVGYTFNGASLSQKFTHAPGTNEWILYIPYTAYDVGRINNLKVVATDTVGNIGNITYSFFVSQKIVVTTPPPTSSPPPTSTPPPTPYTCSVVPPPLNAGPDYYKLPPCGYKTPTPPPTATPPPTTIPPRTVGPCEPPTCFSEPLWVLVNTTPANATFAYAIGNISGSFRTPGQVGLRPERLGASILAFSIAKEGYEEITESIDLSDPQFNKAFIRLDYELAPEGDGGIRAGLVNIIAGLVVLLFLAVLVHLYHRSRGKKKK